MKLYYVSVSLCLPFTLQWRRRSVVRSSHQTVSGASQKLVLPSIFDTSLSSSMSWNLKTYTTNSFEWKNVTFRGSEHTLTSSTYFLVSEDPQTIGSTPLVTGVLQWFIQTPPGGVITPPLQFSCDTLQPSEVQGGLSGGCLRGCLCDRDGRGQILTWTNLFTLWNK